MTVRIGRRIPRQDPLDSGFAVIVVDGSSLVVSVNVHAEHLLRWDAHELIGRHMDVLIPERYRERHHAHAELFMRAPVSRRLSPKRELRLMRGEGAGEITVWIGLAELEPRRRGLIGVWIVEAERANRQNPDGD